MYKHIDDLPLYESARLKSDPLLTALKEAHRENTLVLASVTNVSLSRTTEERVAVAATNAKTPSFVHTTTPGCRVPVSITPSVVNRKSTLATLRISILKLACKEFKVSRANAVHWGKTHAVVEVRFAAAFIMRERGILFPAIGRTLGDRDNTTARNAYQSAQMMMDENHRRFDPIFKDKVERIQSALRRLLEEPDPVETTSTENATSTNAE